MTNVRSNFCEITVIYNLISVATSIVVRARKMKFWMEISGKSEKILRLPNGSKVFDVSISSLYEINATFIKLCPEKNERGCDGI